MCWRYWRDWRAFAGILGAVKDVRRVLNVLEVVLYMLEVVNDVRLWVMGVLLCMLFGILETVEGELRSQEVVE